MKKVVLTALLAATFPMSAAAKAQCFDTLRAAVGLEDFASEMQFKTHDFVTVDSVTIVIDPLGFRRSNAEITHVLTITGENEYSATIRGRFIVENSTLVSQEFCVSDVQASS